MLAPRDNHLDQAWGIVFDLLHGRLEIDDLAKQVSDEIAPAVQTRVDMVLKQIRYHDERDNEQHLKDLLKRIAQGKSGLLEFERFSTLLSTELAGVVFTAHPTFMLSPEANEFALDLMRAGTIDARAGRATSATERIAKVRRSAPPTLQEEFDTSALAIRNVRHAIRRTFHATVDVAAELYPNDYTKLRPGFLTVASWVGFDLDGRTDIGWSKSLNCRYQLALTGLQELRENLAAIRAAHHTSDAVGDALDGAGLGIAALTESFEIGIAALGREAEDATRLGKLNRLALEKRALKIDAIGAIDAALAAAIDAKPADALVRELIVLRAEWESLGLGLSRLHFRLNSAQLHNAIRAEIAMHGAPDNSASRRHYLAEITRLLDGVEPVNVHYGTVAREQTTAKRIFMLAAQFQKHFDSRIPVRLLIAESDTPFTLLTALYYARLFGVERQIEISPLFETADGLHHGDHVIAELLDNAHFLRYIRMRGRFCVQLGFSDSGRYIGQPAASLAVERFKLRVVRLWQARGLGDIQLLFFDTHGESIGRGAHPRSLTDRFLYTHSAEVRARLQSLDAPHKHEVSFQGGEGYLWFASPRTALGVVTDLLSARLSPPQNPNDALYTHSGWGLDFFLTLKDYQERLVKHSGYLWLIDKIGRNLLYPTGSRAMQRQSAGTHTGPGIENIGELRAIPNNAILHQLAYLANCCAGLGAATNQSPDTFTSVLADSDRLERVLSLALAARERSDITMLEAYVQLMGAGYWLDRTNQSLDRDWNRTLRRISSALESAFDHDSIANLVRMLRRDAASLDDVLEQSHVRGGWSSSDALTRLHTLRLALVQFIYLKAMDIPQFSSRLDISLAALMERLLYLDVPETIALLRRIFPAAAPLDDTEVYAERSTYAGAGTSGYAAEHTEIFDPIERAYALILELSALIALRMGAYG
jgi:phosphoenolpyruvate carboxylase